MAHFELWERETLEQFAAEATRKLLENEAEIARLRTGHQRYETARRMNPRQWADAWKLNTSTGKPFDEIIDDMRPFMVPNGEVKAAPLRGVEP